MDYGTIYQKVFLEKKVSIPFTQVGKNIKELLENNLRKQEGLCIEDGFVKPKSVSIISYSNGLLNDEFIDFNISYECDVCHPVEGMILECKVKNLTKAGIRGEIPNIEPSPIMIAVLRDHHINNELFQTIQEGDMVIVEVIGIRYELYDKQISVLAELKSKKEEKKVIRRRKKKSDV